MLCQLTIHISISIYHLNFYTYYVGLGRAMLLDVGGRRHKVLESNFNVFPNTRLGKLARARHPEDILGLCDGYRENGDGHGVPEYFFDRNWTRWVGAYVLAYRNETGLNRNTSACR